MIKNYIVLLVLYPLKADALGRRADAYALDFENEIILSSLVLCQVFSSLVNWHKIWRKTLFVTSYLLVEALGSNSVQSVSMMTFCPRINRMRRSIRSTGMRDLEVGIIGLMIWNVGAGVNEKFHMLKTGDSLQICQSVKCGISRLCRFCNQSGVWVLLWVAPWVDELRWKRSWIGRRTSSPCPEFSVITPCGKPEAGASGQRPAWFRYSLRKLDGFSRRWRA